VGVKNVTISMDQDTLAWARVEAARAGSSLSRCIGERLRRDRDAADDRAAALADMEAFLATPLPGPVADGDRKFSREAIYDERFRR
jgi:hypothetical protein